MSECRREIGLDALTEDWAAVKRLPEHTGLPMAVWITENDGYPHDVRVMVSVVHGGRGSWRAAFILDNRFYREQSGRVGTGNAKRYVVHKAKSSDVSTRNCCQPGRKQ